MINKAFSIVCDRVEQALSTQGYTRQKADSTDNNELVSLFTGETIAYSVIYYIDKMHMVMRACTMTDDGPDNEWKTVSTWMFNPDTDTEREALSIGNDFADAVSAPTAIKRAKQTKKKKKSDDEGTATPLFFAKRLIVLFPELKEEIKNEEECYYPFRGVTFFRASVVPKMQDLLKRGSKQEITKFVSILSAQYANGDADTRSIITIVLLNSTDDQYYEVLCESMSDDLKKAVKCARKYRGKKVKPEKKKVPKKSLAQRLGQ